MRISNPQNMRGSKLITSVVVSEGGLLSGAGTDESPLVFSGVKVKSGNAIVASNVSAIAAGENVTVTPINGVATIGVAVSQVNVASTIASDGEGPVAGSAIHTALGSKLNAPGSNGTSGQVLNTKGDGTTEWKNATVAWSNITGKTSTIAALPTTVGNAGKVLKAVNASTISWGDFDNAVTQTGTNAPANSAVWSHVSAEISSHNANGKHLPTTGTSGQVLYKTATGYEFANLPAAVTSVASATSAGSASSAGYVAAANVHGTVASATSATTATSALSVAWSQVSGAPSLISVSAVASLPTGTSIKSNVIYLVPNGTATGSNVKDEYIYQNNAWELLGTAQVDLTNYVESSVLDGYVPKTRTINGKNLSANVTLTGSDIKVTGVAGALTIASKISTIETSLDSKGVGDMVKSDYVGTNATSVVKSASTAGTLANGITIGNATVNAGSSVTIASIGAASAVHSHAKGDISSFDTEVSSIASNVANAQINDFKITISQGTTSKGSFTLNQGSSGTIVLDAIPTNHVVNTRKINGKQLNADVTLYGTDIKLTSSTGAITLTSKIEALEGQIADAGGGDMLATTYVSAGGTGVVLSAGHATSAESATSATNAASATSAVNASSAVSAGNAAKVNGLTVSTAVPANAKFTDTIPGSAVIKISAGGTSIGSFTVNETSSKNINIPAATSTAYGVVKVVTAMANTTTDAAAISVVSAISSAMNAHMASASIHHAVDSALDGNSTNPVQNKAIVTALNGKQPSLPSGTTGQYLQKTANGVQWADVATGGDYLVTDNLANAALNAPIFFLAHSSASVPGPVEWGLCNRQYFLYSGEDADNGITDTGKLEQGHTYVHSMIGNATFQPLSGNVWTVTRSDLDAPNKAYANPGTWYEQYYFATSNESTLISVQVRYTEAYSWADIKYNNVTERYKLTRNGTNGYYETNVVPAGEIVRATGTVNHYGTNDYNSIELVMSAVPDTAPHPPYYSQSHWMGRFWNGSGWDSPMTEPLLQNDSWISFESAVAEIGGEIVDRGSQNGGYEFIRTERHAGQVIDAMYIDITPATSGGSTTPTTEGVVTVDSGSSASSISVAVVNELPANPQSGVLYFVPTTAIQNLDTSDGISASIVTSLPSSPDADTLYFVTGSN